MKRKDNGGFSLMEVLVAMAVLAAVTIPVCTTITRCAQIDSKAEATLQARIAVSSAVEQLSAVGITAESPNYDIVMDDEEGYREKDLFPGVTVSTTAGNVPSYYNVVVQDDAGLVTVITCIRAADAGEGA